MNNPAISAQCSSFLMVNKRAAQFELTTTHCLLLIAVHMLKEPDYEKLAQACAMSPVTLRAKTSPLVQMDEDALITSAIQKPEGKGKKPRRIFSLTDVGQGVLHVILTGERLERRKSHEQ